MQIDHIGALVESHLCSKMHLPLTKTDIVAFYSESTISLVTSAWKSAAANGIDGAPVVLMNGRRLNKVP